MSAATVVNGVLLAVILATWMWTWWWNRRVVYSQDQPDYAAATSALTVAIIRHENRLMIEIHRAEIAREVVDAANQGKGKS